MELRFEKRTRALVSGLLLIGPPLFGQPEYRYEAWHGHSRPPHIRKAGDLGVLTISERGISFEKTYPSGNNPRHPHAWRWDYSDIQQLRVAPRSLTVLTYRDNKWKLGADREFRFDLVSNKTFQDVYSMLKNRLDQRLVAALAERPASVLWEIPAKHLQRFGGTEGVLRVGTDAIVYSSERKNASRTWRYQDIDNISSSSPFELTVTTFERAKMDYGNRKQFRFQLKQRLEDAEYNDLWLRLNRSKGLKILSSNQDLAAGKR